MAGCILRADHPLPPPSPPNVQGPQGPGLKLVLAVSNTWVSRLRVKVSLEVLGVSHPHNHSL